MPGSWRSPLPYRLGGKARKLISDLYDQTKSNRPTILRGAQGTTVDHEDRMIARMVSTMYRAQQRRINNGIPSKLGTHQRPVEDPDTGRERMLSPLERWERILQISPVVGTSDVERRGAVAAKLKSYASNSADAVETAARQALGSWFYSVETNSIADVLAGEVSHFWPDGAGTTNAPGSVSADYPWLSAVAHVCAVYELPGGAAIEEEDRVRTRCRAVLDDLLPAWCTYDVSRLDSGGLVGFYLDSSSLDYTAL